MIATHYGTPAAVDARVREEFVEHLCLVNEDFNHEKRALLEENDALAAENVTLRKEAEQYRAAEEAQIALRLKMEQERDSLQRLANNRAEQRDSLAAHLNRVTGLVLDLDECEQDSEEMGIAWDTLNSAIQEPASTSLARHDADLLAQPFKNISGCSDHSCLIRKPEGMGTNGGCRCHTDRSKASIIIQRLATLRDKAAGGF